MQPTQTYPYPPAPRRPTPRRVPLAWTIVAVVAAAVLGVVGTLAAQKLTGPGGPIGGGTFVVHGSIDVTGVFGGGAAGQPCDTSGHVGAEDLAPGGQVVVYDAAGKSLAIGALAEGTLRPGGACRMPFTVNGVPDGGGPYFVEVTHRGKVAFTRAQASYVQLSLSLG